MIGKNLSFFGGDNLSKVDTDSLKSQLIILNHLIEEYEENYLNVYHELSTSSLSWQDNHAIRYFDRVDTEKTKIKRSLDELKAVYDIYDYVATNYSELGEKIQFNLMTKGKLFHQLNSYLEKLNGLIKICQQFDYQFSCEANRISSLLERLEKLRDKVEIVKMNLGNDFCKIEEIEKKIRFLNSKLHIEWIQESEISDLFTE